MKVASKTLQNVPSTVKINGKILQTGIFSVVGEHMQKSVLQLFKDSEKCLLLHESHLIVADVSRKGKSKRYEYADDIKVGVF